jgi:hypothetical protein
MAVQVTERVWPGGFFLLNSPQFTSANAPGSTPSIAARIWGTKFLMIGQLLVESATVESLRTVRAEPAVDAATRAKAWVRPPGEGGVDAIGKANRTWVEQPAKNSLHYIGVIRFDDADDEDGEMMIVTGSKRATNKRPLDRCTAEV